MPPIMSPSINVSIVKTALKFATVQQLLLRVTYRLKSIHDNFSGGFITEFVP